ncbi:hypothetical protein HRR83_005589 [Exophiala dermatitidis]|uniref:Signal peptidase subunit 3 n=2 Tax=Exophiala dermatitidis TaxID=5970 RepID=H6BW59_EXODN|nr:uncharacterized protein HMPREF1120_03309 [Exophiala dermatitidis NIH/UT8656]KAJ4502489.1 hypothetical protein HRR75_008470 [Exophiala dermatitidis]EHY55159.1 hypothetical protein HMPREF1120_03309 [Exophiala dermatitidis NIH/UT8656]KAJ4503818.1 hypothetical protein HRR74_009210 [Exophiala dermatitidis]KAJ4508141.1 hypothetical protein HRR73_007579 [Exophiala dermatitidis]KAJ4531935.1 hypothetical protein HRR77_009067 [Exophiala dermatitidis]
MHNALNRIQAVFAHFTTCAFVLASIIALLSVIPVPAPESSPSASVAVRNVQVVKGRPHYYSSKREEYAQIRFDLDADLSSLFTWNTKQLFVYVTANYPSGQDGQGGISEAVIWDTIIPATSTPYSWQNLKQKYFPDNKKTKAKNRRDSNSKAKTTDLVKPGVISLKNQKPKYQITDPSGVISERTNATLQVSWNLQPWVGVLVWDKGYLGQRVGKWDAGKAGVSETFDFPPLKGKQTTVVKDREEAKTPEAGSASPIIEL